MKLIITEKPKVSQKIAQALSSDASKEGSGGVYYYEVRVNGDEVVIASAAGHLYTLVQKKKGWDYPVFDIKWEPMFKTDKTKAYTKKYIDTLKKLGKNADEFYIATDWDIEGELLGYNALIFACKPGGKKIKRMRFSTLTKRELFDAYKKPKDVDLGLVNAGETRHMMDWFWGINTSRALTHATRTVTGRYNAVSAISAGRVQTPALATLVKREKEIAAFKPETYYEVYADLEAKGENITALHTKGKIFDPAKVETILENSKSGTALIKKIETALLEKLPPFPFDLGALQTEAYRLFRYVPKKTQQLAQNLYEGGYISYPRTASQKLPPSIGFKNILENLARKPRFKDSVDVVLKKDRLTPRQGKKDDPAHPAIFPTGVLPDALSKELENLYSLIVFRFLAVFGGVMKIETMNVKCGIGTEEFKFSGKRTVEEGWGKLYPYLKFKDVILPELNEGEKAAVLKVYKEEKETKPPNRFNPSSLVKELENRGLGTKATRAEIVDTLFRRAYVEGNPIVVTDLGTTVINALEEYVPSIISEELTRRFEEKLEDIQKGKETKENILEEAKRDLVSILKQFKEKDAQIGKKLVDALNKKDLFVVGKCPECGGDLRVKKSRKTGGSFIGCDGYPNCTKLFPITTTYGITPTDEKCTECGLSMIGTKSGGKVYLSCIDPKCKSNESKYLVGPCPNCGSDLRIMKARKQFIGCSNYPKCRTSYPLPQRAGIKTTDNKCNACGLPMVSIPLGKRRLLGCIDMNCKSKEKYKNKNNLSSNDK